MTMNTAFTSALGQLRAALATASKNPELKAIIDAKEEVLHRYQPVFCSDHIANLTECEFKEFLLFKNNRHWSGLHRQGNSLCSDMPRLREALGILLNESVPLKQRLDTLIPKSAPPFMHKLGKALITAILHIAYPDRYGVYNGTSETGMYAVGVWPTFESGASFSERYIEINDILNQLAKELQIDLWTLDALWWNVKSEDQDDGNGTAQPLPPSPDDKSFGLERHLHNFMFDNWGKIPLGKEWELYEKDEEIVGYEFDTKEIGKIDLLAKHKSESRWLVIELKRQQTSDETVGQVLRYMGWVSQHLAKTNEAVHGLIIARFADPKLRYALLNTKNVGLMHYRVDFHLDDVPGLSVG